MRPSMSFIKSIYKDTPLIGAEIGVREGEHAQIMLKGLIFEKLYLIDLWGKYICSNKEYNYDFLYAIVFKKFKDCKNVEIIRKDSVLASLNFLDDSLDFVYLDANHQYEYIKKDIEIWLPKIKVGGYLCGHDYCLACAGVMQAVNEIINKTKLTLFTNDTDWWFKKGE